MFFGPRTLHALSLALMITMIPQLYIHIIARIDAGDKHKLIKIKIYKLS